MGKNKFKWPIIWIFIHAIVLFIIRAILDFINISSGVIYLILVGFGITFLANIVKMWTRRSNFVVNKWFFMWFAIHTFSIWIIWLILDAINVQNYLFYLLLSGLGLVLISRTVYKMRIRYPKAILVGVVLLLIFLLFNFGFSITFGDLDTEENANVTTITNQNIIDSFKNIFSGGFSSGCPQLDCFMEPKGTRLSLPSACDGWKVQQIYSYDVVLCHKGNKEGQNINYWYCGDDNLAYVSKTFMNKDGTIGETKKIAFINVYDEDQMFIKTLCLGDPDEIAEKNFKEFMRGIDNLFDF